MYQDNDKDKIVKHTMCRYACKLKMWRLHGNQINIVNEIPQNLRGKKYNDHAINELLFHEN